MRELTYLGRRRVEWRSVAEPVLQGEREALVRPVIAARCDGDNLPIFNRVTTAMRTGVALHYLDPVTTDLLGSRPYGEPFAIGHECIAQVVQCGAAVRGVAPGQLVIVPWAICCGACRNCSEGLTSRCSEAGATLLSAYGFGASMGSWGGAVSDLLRVPYADAMLVPVPESIDPMKLASASDNMPDAWRAIGPPLAQCPGAAVLVVGGAARSIGLYAVGMAAALGASRIDYVDHHAERLSIAERLGARAIESRPGGSWFRRHAPRRHGDYRIALEASSTVAGLRYALRSLDAGGVCTAVGFYFAKASGLPLMQMYANSTTLHLGVSHARAAIPRVIELVAGGAFDPLAVATVIADWDDAPQAFTTPATKVIVRRTECSAWAVKSSLPEVEARCQ
jgi:threonine dehydrogenase-like Zn-dependent dehydrogenase